MKVIQADESTENINSKTNPAAFWARIWAFTIDGIILGIIGFLIGLFFSDFLTQLGQQALLIGTAISVIYFSFCNSKLCNGQTIGKKIMNIQVVNTHGETIDFYSSLGRSIVLCVPYFASYSNMQLTHFPMVNIIKSIMIFTIIICIIVLYIFNNKTRQSLHDLLTGTIVVKKQKSNLSNEFPAITRTPFVAFALILALFLGSSSIFLGLNYEQYKKNNLLQQELSKLPTVQNAIISYTYIILFNNQSQTSLRVQLNISRLPEGELNKNKLVNDAIHIILENSKYFPEIEFIDISFAYGYNMGIAKQYVSRKLLLSNDKTTQTWHVE